MSRTISIGMNHGGAKRPRVGGQWKFNFHWNSLIWLAREIKRRLLFQVGAPINCFSRELGPFSDLSASQPTSQSVHLGYSWPAGGTTQRSPALFLLTLIILARELIFFTCCALSEDKASLVVAAAVG